MTMSRVAVVLAAVLLGSMPLPATAQPSGNGRSFDPTAEHVESPLVAFLVGKGTVVTPMPALAPGVSSYRIASPDGAAQSIHVLSDGLTFIAGEPQPSLKAEEVPRSPDVLPLGEIAPDVEGWLPRSWMTQSLVGVLYTVPGAPLPVRGYAYRFFPGRDIIDNLSAVQLVKAAADMASAR